MDEMESKMGAILGNPELMQKIMAMAQSLNDSGSAPQTPPPPKEEPQPAGASLGIDIATLQKLSGLAGRSRIDKNQQSLLRALSPYLNRERIQKLEKAMRAAKMASMASGFLSNTGR